MPQLATTDRGGAITSGTCTGLRQKGYRTSGRRRMIVTISMLFWHREQNRTKMAGTQMAVPNCSVA